MEQNVNTSVAPATAASVANQFLDFGDKEGCPIDQMKLQKLLFYAHAWYLAMNGRPLFDDDFQAWPWGPVIPDIYYQTRAIGRSAISSRLTHLEKIGTDVLQWRYVVPPGIVDPEVKAFLQEVWLTHKAYSGVQLSNSTHAPGEPWTIVKDQYGSNLYQRPTIPNDLIADIFKAKLDKYDLKNTAA